MRKGNLMKLEQIVATTLDIPVERVNDELSLDNCPEWTSLEHIALITALESEYSVQFDIEDSIEMDSVGSIREVLEGKGINVDE